MAVPTRSSITFPLGRALSSDEPRLLVPFWPFLLWLQQPQWHCGMRMTAPAIPSCRHPNTFCSAKQIEGQAVGWEVLEPPRVAALIPGLCWELRASL